VKKAVQWDPTIVEWDRESTQWRVILEGLDGIRSERWSQILYNRTKHKGTRGRPDTAVSSLFGGAQAEGGRVSEKSERIQNFSSDTFQMPEQGRKSRKERRVMDLRRKEEPGEEDQDKVREVTKSPWDGWKIMEGTQEVCQPCKEASSGCCAIGVPTEEGEVLSSGIEKPSREQDSAVRVTTQVEEDATRRKGYEESSVRASTRKQSIPCSHSDRGEYADIDYPQAKFEVWRIQNTKELLDEPQRDKRQTWREMIGETLTFLRLVHLTRPKSTSIAKSLRRRRRR